ncbi:O-antigen translocase [Aestuariibaculum suncheonense]|uniref:O-antigen translocase n=1 Tax=Aestuariibaculum suncheonense TaxID=1028745 RepID=A0A8J6Q5D8_9FLAO|nr:O-antigen translocase [Aestuariibaculum suncheonense]MBD0834499.1 O-antigen translocase [Aestuariibaculum suncheonense]
MKKLIDYINNNVLIKVTSLQTTSVITRLIAGILTSKAIAVFIGPVGLALIGNLQNFVSAFQTISIAGLYNGTVKYISELKESVTELSKVVSTVFYVGFMSTVLVSFFCYFNADLINDLIFPSYNNYAFVIKVFAFVLPFYALNMFSFSIMNGFSKYKILIVINIIGQILSMAVALLLIYQNAIKGALISVAIAESLIFLITLVGIINRRSLIPLIRVKGVSFSFLKQMSSYALMALFSAVLLPVVAIAIRMYIVEHVGYKDAGFWEAMTRISKYYLMMVTSLMALYILPRFSEIDDVKEFRKEVFGFYKIIIPILVIGLVAIYILKGIIVSVVLTDEFRPVEDLFLWQLLGDFLKVLSTVIAYQFLAKKMFWHYILTEAFLIITLYTTSIYFIDLFDSVKGAVVAHFVTYIMYYGIILLMFGSSLFGVVNQEDQN